MKVRKISNVNLVVNHILRQAVSRNTSIEFIKAINITHVMLDI